MARVLGVLDGGHQFGLGLFDFLGLQLFGDLLDQRSGVGHVPALGDQHPLHRIVEALRYTLAIGIGAGKRHHGRCVAALRRVEQQRRALGEVEQLRVGIAVDIEPEQELGARIAILGGGLQFLFRSRDVVRLKRLEARFHVGKGGRCAADDRQEQRGCGKRSAAGAKERHE